MKFRGVHGTCITHARTILASGISRVAAGRAGSGFYLWAYQTDPRDAAIDLAEDWYHWKFGIHDFDSCPERGFAMLTCEIDIDPNSYINLNQARHHETLRTVAKRAGGSATQTQVYDSYLALQSDIRLKQYGVPLLVVEVMVPYPQATKRRARRDALTPGADAYIVLRPGFSGIQIQDVFPGELRS